MVCHIKSINIGDEYLANIFQQKLQEHLVVVKQVQSPEENPEKRIVKALGEREKWNIIGHRR